MTALPKPRGPLSTLVTSALRAVPDEPVGAIELEPGSLDDAAVTLWVLHELSYGGFAEVDDRAEWEPELLRVRRDLEQELEARLREEWPGVPEGVDLEAGFFDWVGDHDGPSLARHVQTSATA